jgi:protein-tyrosine-phosphatase
MDNRDSVSADNRRTHIEARIGTPADAGESSVQPPRLPIRVLFLCTANAARSQIAEALLGRKGGDRFYVGSTGTNPALRVHEDAIATLATLGIDWSGRKPKGFDAVSSQEWDMVITLCDRSREACSAIPGRPVYAHWGVPDPAIFEDDARRRRAFSETAQLLSWRIDLMLTVRVEALQKAVLEDRLKSIGLAKPTEAPLETPLEAQLHGP